MLPKPVDRWQLYPGCSVSNMARFGKEQGIGQDNHPINLRARHRDESRIDIAAASDFHCDQLYAQRLSRFERPPPFPGVRRVGRIG